MFSLFLCRIFSFFCINFCSFTQIIFFNLLFSPLLFIQFFFAQILWLFLCISFPFMKIFKRQALHRWRQGIPLVFLCSEEKNFFNTSLCHFSLRKIFHYVTTIVSNRLAQKKNCSNIIWWNWFASFDKLVKIFAFR